MKGRKQENLRKTGRDEGMNERNEGKEKKERIRDDNGRRTFVSEGRERDGKKKDDGRKEIGKS